MKKIKTFFVLLISVLIFSLISCSDADIVRVEQDIDKHNFEVYRRIVFYNGITNDYILVIEGYFTIKQGYDKDIVVTVKTENGKYLKHYLGLSDNVTYFSEQLEPSMVSDKHYKVIFKPSEIIPYIEGRK